LRTRAISATLPSAFIGLPRRSTRGYTQLALAGPDLAMKLRDSILLLATVVLGWGQCNERPANFVNRLSYLHPGSSHSPSYEPCAS
jgi:hypothetical protein